MSATQTHSASTYLLCQVDVHVVGIIATAIREVVEMPWVEPVGHAPAHVLGVVDYRGTAIPVLSLAGHCLANERAISVDDHLVIVDNAGGHLIALHVERALRLEVIADTTLQADGDEDDRLLAPGCAFAKRVDGLIVTLDPRALADVAL